MKIFFYFILIACVLFIFVTTGTAQKKDRNDAVICISGEFEDGNSTDTVTIEFWDTFLSVHQMNYTPPTTLRTVCVDGKFRFKIQGIIEPTYFSLINNRFNKVKDEKTVLPLIYLYLSEPGDEISMKIGKFNPTIIETRSGARHIWKWGIEQMSFKGHQSSKYNYLWQLDMERKKRDDRANALIKINGPRQLPTMDSDYYLKMLELVRQGYRSQDSLLSADINILKSYRKAISADSYDILQADLLGEYEGNKCDMTYNLWAELNNEKKLSVIYINYLKDNLLHLYSSRHLFLPKNISANALSHSRGYIRFLVAEASCEDRFNGIGAGYIWMKKNYTGQLRDKAITDYTLYKYLSLPDAGNILKDALSIVHVKYCWDLLNNMYNNQSEGKPAYDFALTDINGKSVKLYDFRGKIVFLDFWYTGCGGCEMFYHNVLSKVEEKFRNNPEVVFVTISIDRDKDIWIKNVKLGRQTTPDAPNVINLYTNGEGTDHPVAKAFNVVYYPQQTIIDQQGKIYKINNLFKNSPEELIPIIDEALRKH